MDKSTSTRIENLAEELRGAAKECESIARSPRNGPAIEDYMMGKVNAFLDAANRVDSLLRPEVAE